jgi:biopolymer transport protein ExbD
MSRRITRSASGGGDDINVTPLMDIVFIMLIFFIVTATFTREKGIDIKTPDNSPNENDTVPPPALLLSVEEDGWVRVNRNRTIDAASTKAVVEEFMAREPKGVVLVSAAPTAKAGVTVTVMDLAKAGNATAVSLALSQEE